MKKFTMHACFLLLLIASCHPGQDEELAELMLVFDQLKHDTNNEFLLTLKPSESECREIFNEGLSADKAVEYSESKWMAADKISPNSMKPVLSNAKINILSASKRELSAGITNGIPSDYVNIADHLKAGTRLYALQYLNEDGSEQKMRAAFFKVNNRWVIIPRAFMAFQ